MNRENLYSGIIVKSIGGFYYVKTPEDIFETRARGIFRKNSLKPLVGDTVSVMLTGVNDRGMKEGVIEKIQERKNVFQRPPVANIDQMVIVFSTIDPEPNLSLIDRIIMTAEHKEIETLVIINKADLLKHEDKHYYKEIYKKAGYTVITTSAVTMEGIEQLKKELTGRISALAGPSGVGKSSILNILVPGINMETGILSKKIKRGRHTTRYCELVELSKNSMIVDTPGFSTIDLKQIQKEEIQYMFKEFKGYIPLCRFAGCLHNNEPSCGVKNAVLNNDISKERYDNYRRLIEENKEFRRY